jgi:hypothetical protein
VVGSPYEWLNAWDGEHMALPEGEMLEDSGR